jgi:hypothetical protein
MHIERIFARISLFERNIRANPAVERTILGDP